MNTQLSKPGNVSTSGILLVIGGVLTLFTTIATASFMIPITFCFWTPITIYGLVAGILSIVKGAQLAGNVQPGAGVPVAAPVLLMINLINFDIFGPVLGIIALVLASDSQTKAWLEGRGVPTLMAPGAMPSATNITPGAPQSQWGGTPAPAQQALAVAPQWGDPAQPQPPTQPQWDPPTPSTAEPQWGTATPESEAAADQAVKGGSWSDWGGPVAEPEQPQDTPPVSAAPQWPEDSPPAPAAPQWPQDSAPAPEWPQDQTPVEVAPAAGDEWGAWSGAVSVQETPPEADPLRPEAWDLGDDLNKKP